MYIHNECTSLKSYANHKIKVLCHFGILDGRTTKKARSIRAILDNCKSDIEMDRKLYSVVHGIETIDSLIAREESKCRN